MIIMTFACIRYFSFLIFTCVTTSLLSQDRINVSFGNLTGNSTSIQTFKKQQEIKVSKGYSVDSVIFFISIPEKGIFQVDYYPYYDSSKFNRCLGLLKPGCSVVINTVLEDKNFKKLYHQISYALISDTDIEINYRPSPSVKEALELKKWKIINGTVYFSGEGFSTVSMFTNQEKRRTLSDLINLCMPGSKITIDNVVYVDSLGKRFGPISKIIKIE
jgi:hypothetical protein